MFERMYECIYVGTYVYMYVYISAEVCTYKCTCGLYVHANIYQNNQPFIPKGHISVASSVCTSDTVTNGTALCSWITDSSTLF
jgi:hypothetical protein